MSALDDLRAARRRNRVEAIHWIDALYQVYLTAVLGGVAVLVVSGIIGDERLGPWRTSLVLRDGPDVLGVVAAVVLWIGLRSGAHGGPLAIEKADVRHVLLAPVDRGEALRPLAYRQLRFVAFVAVVVGAIAGQLAVRRLGGAPLAWIASGAAFAAATVALAYGGAMVMAGRRLPAWLSTVVGGGLFAWALGDALDLVKGSPTGELGKLAFWPLDVDPLALVPVLGAAAVVGLGVAALSGVSPEQAERRTPLVGELKFAVTLQDLRTAMVLRRQLAMELPRHRPWIRQHSPGHFPVWHRGTRSVLRWPGARIVRIVVVGAAVGVAMRAVWEGTTPLVVVAGLALYIAALDAIEPFAQEIDHPGRTEAVPRPVGDLLVRHLPLPGVVMIAVVGIGAAVAVALDPSAEAAALAALTVVPAALAAVAGASLSVFLGMQEHSDSWELVPPEVGGLRSLFRLAGPPLIVVAGLSPVRFARSALDAGEDPFGAAATTGAAVLVVVALVAGWIHQREPIKAWFRTARAMQEARLAGADEQAVPVRRKPTPTRVTTTRKRP
jgi:hypothetical protein